MAFVGDVYTRYPSEIPSFVGCTQNQIGRPSTGITLRDPMEYFRWGHSVPEHKCNVYKYMYPLSKDLFNQSTTDYWSPNCDSIDCAAVNGF